ncbi:MAG: hypothetical protein ACYDBJ_02745 [Aggregatilineales bacterium]
MKYFKVSLAITLAVVVLLGTRTVFAQGISVQFNFQSVRQGQVGVVVVTGADMASANATAIDHSYPCFPTSQGAACLIAVPMDQAIKRLMWNRFDKKGV